MKLTIFIIIFLIAIFVISLFTKVGNQMIRIYKTRSIGIGTLSFLFLLMAILWSFSFHEFCLGDRILSLLHLPSWSNGTSGRHYTIYYALLFLFPALIVGIRNKHNLFVRTGIGGSIVLIVVIASSLFMGIA